MRQIGSIADAALANRFADYLFTLGIESRVDPSSANADSANPAGPGAVIWIRDEEQVEQAKQEFAAFLQKPADPRYQSAEGEARIKRQQLQRQQQAAGKNVVDMRQRWAPFTAGAIPATLTLIGVCVVVAVLTRCGNYFAKDAPREPLQLRLMFSEPPSSEQLIAMLIRGEKWSPLDDIREGQVWRLVTPMLLHFGPLHLLFNMLMLRDVGGLIESRRGALRFVALVLLFAVTSNFAQYYFTGNPNFGGMSGVVYGLIGYAWMKSRFDPRSGIFLSPNTVVMAMIWFVVCLLDLVEHVANWAHGAGLVVGVVMGYLPVAFDRLHRKLT